eukprot:COSAG02_NODE_2831_length_7935_cov_5.630296_7_plen_296_part_00
MDDRHSNATGNSDGSSVDSAYAVGVFEQMRRAKEVSAAIARTARRNRITVGQAFREFDSDNSGAITPDEMLTGLRKFGVFEALNFTVDGPTAVGLVESFDLDHDGVLTERDWRDYFRALRRELEQDTQHQNAPHLQPVDSTVVDTPLARTSSDDNRVDALRRQTSTAEWHDSIREYETGAEIGEGSFGKVHLWTHRATGRQYACKKMNKLRMDEEDMVILDREIKLLRELNHPNIVKLHRTMRCNRCAAAVTCLPYQISFALRSKSRAVVVCRRCAGHTIQAVLANRLHPRRGSV